MGARFAGGKNLSLEGFLPKKAATNWHWNRDPDPNLSSFRPPQTSPFAPAERQRPNGRRGGSIPPISKRWSRKPPLKRNKLPRRHGKGGSTWSTQRAQNRPIHLRHLPLASPLPPPPLTAPHPCVDQANALSHAPYIQSAYGSKLTSKRRIARGLLGAGMDPEKVCTKPDPNFLS